jgi:ABC-type dipeptide/oligopeptide/nickel transport system ATPase component
MNPYNLTSTPKLHSLTRVAILPKGCIVEKKATKQFLSKPLHTYTWLLIESSKYSIFQKSWNFQRVGVL